MSTPRWEPTSDVPYVGDSMQSSSSTRPISPAWDPACDLSYLANLSSHPIESPKAPLMSTTSYESSLATRRAEPMERMSKLDTINVNPPAPPSHHRKAIWHPQSGLFVSPNATYIPKMEEYTVRRPDWSIPRVLPDDEIYLAFRPRIIRNSGDLFGRLNLSRSALAKAIMPASGGYALEEFLLEAWLRLENALLDLSESLRPKSGVPLLSYPKFPYECGYRQSHRTKDAALRCAVRSRDAFIELSSLVSFIIALNMDKHGSYEAAFYKLRTRRHNPVHSAWLDLLKISQVCDFSDNFRVGVVVNPYKCQWGPQLYNFHTAHVPIWIFWGHHYKNTPAANPIFDYFLPPDEAVEDAINLTKKSADLIAPSYRFDPFAPSASLQELEPDIFASASDVAERYAPDSPRRLSPPPVSTSTDTWAVGSPSAAPHLPELSNRAAAHAKALAVLEEFFTKRREILERRMATETQRERQVREGREANAKSRVNFSRKSKVYEWVVTGDGVYERVALESKQAVVNWSNYKKNQRHYTSYNDEWDLCPQLPKYSDEFPDLDNSDFDDDDDSDGADFVPMGTIVTSAPRTLAIPNDGHQADTLLDLQTMHRLPGAAAKDADAPPLAEVFDLAPFLRDRIGYDLSTKWPIQTPKTRNDMPPPPSTSSRRVTGKASRRDDSPPHRTSSSHRGEMGYRRRREATPPPRTSSLHRGEQGYRRRREETPPRTASSSRREKGKAPNNKAANSSEGDAIISISKAFMSLSLSEVAVNADAEAGILNLANRLASSKGTFADLPPNFDHSTTNSAPLSLASDTIELLVASSSTPPVYLLRNLGGSLRTDPWMIATGDASTVLLVFRKNWPTVDIIARELVQRGARFNTVKAVANRPQPASLPVRPLGIRLKGYTPSREDYEEYVRRRNDLLRGPKGRAALMRGGIIARIARDILPEHGVVLDGPISGDHVICEYDNLFLVDDLLTETDKNVICGVYFAQTEQSPEGEKLVDGATLELSWWPKDSLWNAVNCYLRMEWTELAEAFYMKRHNQIQSKLTIINATDWRKFLRKANSWTRKIEAGIEHYQRGYVDHCLESVPRAAHA